MKSIQTVYPCPSCKFENRPINQFCTACGARLPNWADGSVYNLFYRKVNTPFFKMMFKGDPILTLDDAKEAAWECINLNHGRYEFYIGEFLVHVSIEEGVPFSVWKWYPVGYMSIKQDLGPCMVRVTFDE